MESAFPTLITVAASAGFVIGVPAIISLVARIERNLG